MRTLSFSTKGEFDMVELTGKVRDFVDHSDLEEGAVLLFAPGSTCALITLEDEPGLLEDFKKTIRDLIPRNAGYLHDKIDNNAHSHLRAAILRPSLVLPVVDGQLVHGTWQQIFFLDLDVKPRKREVLMKLLPGL